MSARPLLPPQLRLLRLLPWLLTLGVALAAEEPTSEARITNSPIAEGLILFGCLFILAAALGMLRFPDFYTRLHASTKIVTLGGIGIFGGAAIGFAPLEATSRVLLIAAFFFLTAPISGYMIARSGYLRGLTPYAEADSVDEWQAHGAANATAGAAAGATDGAADDAADDAADESSP